MDLLLHSIHELYHKCFSWVSVNTAGSVFLFFVATSSTSKSSNLTKYPSLTSGHRMSPPSLPRSLGAEGKSPCYHQSPSLPSGAPVHSDRLIKPTGSTSRFNQSVYRSAAERTSTNKKEVEGS